MSTPSTTRRKTRKAVEIRAVPETAPWILVKSALQHSGVSQREIRAKFFLRKFGNAHFVRPREPNHWILMGELVQAQKITPEHGKDQP